MSGIKVLTELPCPFDVCRISNDISLPFLTVVIGVFPFPLIILAVGLSVVVVFLTNWLLVSMISLFFCYGFPLWCFLLCFFCFPWFSSSLVFVASWGGSWDRRSGSFSPSSVNIWCRELPGCAAEAASPSYWNVVFLFSLSSKYFSGFPFNLR